MRGQEFRARDKKVQKLTRDGLVERNQSTGEERRVSQRTADISFGPERTQEQAANRPAAAARHKQTRKKQAQNIPAETQASPETVSELSTQTQVEAGQPAVAAHGEESTQSSENPKDAVAFGPSPVIRDTRDIPLRDSGDAFARSSHRKRNKRQNAKTENSQDQEPLRDGRLQFRETGFSDDKPISEKYRNLKEEAQKQSESETEEIPQDGRLQFDHKQEGRAKSSPPKAKKRKPVKRQVQPIKNRISSEQGRLQFNHAPPAETDKLLKQKRRQAKRVLSNNSQPTENDKTDENTEVQEVHEAPENSRLQFEHAPPVKNELPIKSRQNRRSSQQSQPEQEPSRRGRLRFEDEPPVKDKPKEVQKRRPVKPIENTAEPEGTEDSEASDAAQQETTHEEPPQQGRLRFEDTDKKTGDTAENVFASRRQKRKYEKAERRVEQASRKLEKAQSKIPVKRRVRLAKQYDSASGKVRHRLCFEEETIPEDAKPALPKRVGGALVRTAGTSVILKGHEKMRQVERENVGVEAAHKTEFAVEQGAARFLRWNKNRLRHKPYNNVRKAERRLTREQSNLAWQTALRDNPELRRKNALMKAIQKYKIKRKYAQAAREAQKATQHTQTVLNAAGQVIRSAAQTIAARKTVFIMAALLTVVIVMFSAGLTSCTAMLSGIQASYISASYMANEDDITNADLYYTEMETDLQIDIDKTEENYPGYDEYRYNIGDISHNPYELMGYLSTKFDMFTFEDIKAELERIFGLQYTLTREVITEDHSIILVTTLTVKPLSEVIEENLAPGEQLDRYGVYMQTYGNRQSFDNPFDFPWLSYVTSGFGWRVHPISGEKSQHTGIDIAVPEGTAIRACQNGRVVSVGENGGYGLCVVIEDAKGYRSLYGHCSGISVSAGQEVRRGDVIAAVGSTGDSTGPHLHLETMLNGEYLNPYYFVETGGDMSAAPVMLSVTEIPDDSGEPMGGGTFAAMMDEAEKYIGYPYVFGGSSPSTSFDCSGYVCWVINQSGVGSVGRTTAQGLFNMCTPVSSGNAKPGDLVFFSGTYSTTDTVTHVGIYVGNGKMIHCGSPIGYADLSGSYWSSHLYSYGRIN